MYPHQKLDWSASRLETRLNEAPNDRDARLELGRIYLSRGLYHGGGEQQCAQALAVARRLMQDNQDSARDSADALIVAGTALVGMDRPESAQKYLDEALKMDATRPDLHMALGAMYRAQGDRQTALRHLDLAVRGSPESWEVHLLLGRTLSEQARRGGSRAEGRAEGRPEGRAESRMIERSQYHLVQALKIGPPPELLHPLMRDLGLLCLQTGRYVEAEKLFVRIRENPKYALVARKYLGQVAFGLGKYKNAIQHFRHYLEERSDDAHTLAQVAMCYLQLEERERAREAAERALLLEPGLVAARHILGCTFLESQQIQEAMRIFRETLQEHPEDMLSYVELTRMRRQIGDAGWLQKALHAEVSSHDRLPFGGGEAAPRNFTRRRIGVLLKELRAGGPSAIQSVLSSVELSDDEGLRFALWEAASSMAAEHVGQSVAARMKEPGKHFSVGLARSALSAADFIPEPALTMGLSLSPDDVKRAAVERRGNGTDVAQHRRMIDAENELARAWQAILLLSVASRRSRSGRALLQSWAGATGGDPDLHAAVQVGLAILGEPEATRALLKRAQERGATVIVERLLAQVTPPAARAEPRPISGKNADKDVHCSVCGRTTGGDCTHLMSGTSAVLCNVCVSELQSSRRPPAAPDGATCDLCGRTHFEARALYRQGGDRQGGGVRRVVDVCTECVDLSSGLLERDEVDRFLREW